MSKRPSLQDLWRVGYHADRSASPPAPLHVVAPLRRRRAHVSFRLRGALTTDGAARGPRSTSAEHRGDARFIESFGEQAREELAPEPVTEAWRRRNVLAPATVAPSDVGILDLADAAARRDLEDRHAALLAEHGLEHLDLYEITTRRRVVTQTIAADGYRRLGVGVICFRSSRDGGECFAILEDHATLEPAGDIVALTDPPLPALGTVVEEFGLALAPAPP